MNGIGFRQTVFAGTNVSNSILCVQRCVSVRAAARAHVCALCEIFCVVPARTVARGGACVLLVGTAVELATAREEGSHDVRYLGIT